MSNTQAVVTAIVSLVLVATILMDGEKTAEAIEAYEQAKTRLNRLLLGEQLIKDAEDIEKL